VTYQILPARGTPTPRSLPHLYDSLDKQFAYGLDRILDGLGISHDFPLPLTSDQPGRQPKADHRGRQRCRYESELEHIAARAGAGAKGISACAVASLVRRTKTCGRPGRAGRDFPAHGDSSSSR